MFVDSNISLFEHVRQLMDEYRGNLDKRGDQHTDMFWSRLVGMRLNVHSLMNQTSLPHSGTMTITNVEYYMYPLGSTTERGIYQMRIEVDRRFWNERRVCYLQCTASRQQTLLVVEGPGEPVEVNAYLVHERPDKKG